MFLNKLQTMTGVNFWLDLIDAVQLDVYLSCFISMDSIDHPSAVNAINLTLSLIGTLLGISLAIVLITYIRKACATEAQTQNQTSVGATSNERFRFLVQDYNTSTKYGQYHRPFAILRDLLIACLIVWLNESPTT